MPVATGTREPRQGAHPPRLGAASLAARRDARQGPRLGSSYLLILALVGTLLAVGLVMVLSASSVAAFARTGDSYTYLKRQAIWAGTGVVLMLVVSRVDYHRWRRWAWPLLGVTALLLLIPLLPFTHAITPTINGARRWVNLGVLTLQPSELAKFTGLMDLVGPAGAFAFAPVARGWERRLRRARANPTMPAWGDT